jgi:catechol 1,2-dioxygenase
LQITSPGFQTLVTQVFDRASEYCDNDAVFAVKDDIVVDFAAVADSDTFQYELEYDFHLSHLDVVKEFGLANKKPVI